MIRKLTCLLVCFAQLPCDFALGSAPPIAFVAQAESEALAEEAILLLHCLAARAGTSWEFSGEAAGRHWLKVTEKSGQLEGSYRREESTKPFRLRTGGSEETCDELEPAPAGAKLEPGPALSPALSSVEEEPEPAAGGRTWLWVGASAAVVAGFLFWKSRQPRHKGIEMKN